jgi:hypothetical protein
MNARFWPRWMLAVTAGETIGFAIPALTGGMLALLSAPVFVVYPSMIVAGACEGVLLGLGQSIGFGPSVVPRSAWIRATAAGAALAWSIGMLPSTIGGVDFGSPIALSLVVIDSIALLVSIPTLQWAVLRRLGHPVSSWVPLNAAAWTAVILWTLAPSPFIDEHTPATVLFGVYLLAGLLMAATVASLTGPSALRIVGFRNILTGVAKKPS